MRSRTSPVERASALPQAAASDLLTFAFDPPKPYDPQRPIYIDAEDPSRSLNASQTRCLVRRLIAGLRAQGLRQGDCVAVHLANNFLYSALYFSIIGAGGIYLGSNPANQEFEFDHLLQLTEPKFIFTTNDVLPCVLKCSADRGIPASRIFVLDHFSLTACSETDYLPSPPSSRASSIIECEKTCCSLISDLLTNGEEDWIRFDDVNVAKATPACYFTTSGTSGLPKAAILSHYAMIAQHLSLCVDVPYQVQRLLSLPFFHIFGALFAHMQPIRLGQPLYILPRFNLKQFVEAIQRFAITDTCFAPPVVHALNRSPPELLASLGTLHWAGVGGAPIDAAPLMQLQQHFHPDGVINQVWGMTEVGAAMLLHWPERDDTGSVGRPLAGYEMQLRDSHGHVIEAESKPGELFVRYAGKMNGYRGMSPEQDEWFRSGDIMCVKDGKYYVTGRAKELIKVKGWQVAPAELEAVLLLHPEIDDAAVIGALREDGVTEVPKAFVILKKHLRANTLTTQEVYDFARERLASYKALDGGVVFVEHIPRTASGKIQRFKLEQMNRHRESVITLLQNCSNTLFDDPRNASLRESGLKKGVATSDHNTRRQPRRAAKRYTGQPPSTMLTLGLPERRRSPRNAAPRTPTCLQPMTDSKVSKKPKSLRTISARA